MKFISYCFKALSPAVSQFLVIIVFILSITGCQWGDEVVSLVQPDPDDFTALYSDSSTVLTSTVAPDSVMTGSATRVFVGRFVDPYLGRMHSSSFFQPTLASALTVPEKAVYDSLILSLPYDGYYYGDTTKPMNLAVYALQEDILTRNAYYNDDSTPYDPTPLGRVRFLPHPGTPNKTVNIKLSGELGQKIFDLAKANLFGSNADWINVLKGVAVIPATSDNSAVVGFKSFKTAEASIATTLQLHFHTPETEGVTKDSSLINVTALYNQVMGDRSQTILSKLPANRRISLPSSQTGELTFIQAGTGIMTRVDLPTVRQLKYNKYTFANRAYLRITPLQVSVTVPFRLPGTIYAYLCDKNNEYYQSGSTGYPVPASDLNGAAVTGTLINDLVNNQQYYQLDISQYVSDILRSDSEEAAGLLLRTSPFSTNRGAPSFPDLDSDFTKSFHRLVIGSQNNSTSRGIKLELYYTTVKPQ